MSDGIRITATDLAGRRVGTYRLVPNDPPGGDTTAGGEQQA